MPVPSVTNTTVPRTPRPAPKRASARTGRISVVADRDKRNAEHAAHVVHDFMPHPGRIEIRRAAHDCRV